MGLISFYSEMAAANPEKDFELVITAVERESSFLELYNYLTGKLISTCTSNLNVAIRLVHADALDYSAGPEKYDLLIESNMLNSSEGIRNHAIEPFSKVLDAALEQNGLAILIEPGKSEDRDYLFRLADSLSAARIAEQLFQPKTIATDVSGISLYREAYAAGLRSLRKDQHWFSYMVMEKGS